VANTLNNLGAVAEVARRRRGAERRYREALDAAKAAGEELVAGLALGNLGACGARERGDLDEARALHAEAGAVFDRLGYRVGQASPPSTSATWPSRRRPGGAREGYARR
jgi:hypothetical protein